MRLKIIISLFFSLVVFFLAQNLFGFNFFAVENIDNRLLPVIVLIAFFSEYVDSSLGMGYGTTLTPVLVLMGIPPKIVVPAILFSELCTGMTAVFCHHLDGNVDFLKDKVARKTAFLLSMLSVAGSVGAVLLAVKLTTSILTLVIGLIILAVGIVILLTINRQLKFSNSHIVALGTIAAFNKGLSGGGYGPLVTGGQVVSGINAKSAVSITSLAESFACLTGLICYQLFGDGINWKFAIVLSCGALLSVPLSTLTVKKISEKRMRLIIGLITCLLGSLMLSKLLFKFSVQV